MIQVGTIQVGHDPSTGTLLRVAGVRVLGLRTPVTLVGADPNRPPNRKPPQPPPQKQPYHGETSQAAPSGVSTWTPPPPSATTEAPTAEQQPQKPFNYMYSGWW